MTTLSIDIQVASSAESLPSDEEVHRWVSAALSDMKDVAELSIRYIDMEESAELNQRYRNKSGPTNVLSFPFEAPPGVNVPLLGDIAICAPLVEQEAATQHKQVKDHWAHMIIHGTLHLLGYDHVESHDALIMEGLEASLLADLGIANPYENIPILTPVTLPTTPATADDGNISSDVNDGLNATEQQSNQKGQSPEQGQAHPLRPPSGN